MENVLIVYEMLLTFFALPLRFLCDLLLAFSLLTSLSLYFSFSLALPVPLFFHLFVSHLFVERVYAHLFYPHICRSCRSSFPSHWPPQHTGYSFKSNGLQSRFDYFICDKRFESIQSTISRLTYKQIKAVYIRRI